jgi:hypothetical protein
MSSNKVELLTIERTSWLNRKAVQMLILYLDFDVSEGWGISTGHRFMTARCKWFGQIKAADPKVARGKDRG